MKTGNIFGLIVVLLLLTAIGWLVFSVLNTRTDRDYPWNKTKLDEVNFATALDCYFSVYNSIPTGNAELVERILSGEDLSGKNPRKIQFLNFKPGAKYTNEMVDAWGAPYQIKFLAQTNFIIQSAGCDHQFGSKDDITFNRLSNDFVKP